MVTDFSACNPNRSAPMIKIIATNSTREDHAVTAACQFRLHADILVRFIWSFFSQEKRITSLILRPHTYTIKLATPCASPSTILKVFLFQSTIKQLFPVLVHHSTTPIIFLCRSFILYWSDFDPHQDHDTCPVMSEASHVTNELDVPACPIGTQGVSSGPATSPHSS